jgi:hypothetical protein
METFIVACRGRVTLVESMRVLLALVLAAVSLCAQPPEPFGQVEEMLASLARITGWHPRRTIRSERLSQEKFTRMVEKSAAAAERDKSTRAIELTLKMFGLAPWDFNLARESADLLEEQAAAFYDYRKKRLYVLDSTAPGSEQVIALAHELAHALADQQFNLRKFLDGAKNDDAAMARQAVIEGQASWLSWAYMSERAGGQAEVPRALLEELSQLSTAGEDYPVLANTPLYMRESLTFPYAAGMAFQDAVFRLWGRAAFTSVFTRPPQSSQEVLHPERYHAGAAPLEPALPKQIPGLRLRDWKQLTKGDVGEFDFAVLLRQYAGEVQGRRVASHWRGASYALFEHRRSKAPLLVHVSEWDTPEAARDFFLGYQDVLRGKWRSMTVTRAGDSELAGHGDTGDFLLQISGTRVQCVEGLPEHSRLH